MDTSLSSQGAKIASQSTILEQGFKMCLQDLYDKETNIQGFINLGTSENKICFDLLHERLTKPDMNYLEPSLLEYSEPQGIRSLRVEVAKFLSHYCQAPAPLNPDSVLIMNGCRSIFSSLANVIFNPGDGFLIPTPYYSLIKKYMSIYTWVQPVEVPLCSKITETESHPFQLTITKLENAIKKGTREGVKIRALILINPQNPLGEIYSKEFMIECLKFGQRYNLHVIIDELYMLSVFKNATFTSVLSLPEFPDPERTHFIWGVSKDFAMSGMRVGMFYTKNQHVLKSMAHHALLHQCPGPTQYVMARLLSDRVWLDSIFFPINKQRLEESQLIVVNGLQELGIPVLKSSAGLCVWADFRKFLTSQTFEAEMELWQMFLQEKFYIAPGKAFECCEPGWFRLTFSLPSDILQKCIEKLGKLFQKVPDSDIKKIELVTFQ